MVELDLVTRWAAHRFAALAIVISMFNHESKIIGKTNSSAMVATAILVHHSFGSQARFKFLGATGAYYFLHVVGEPVPPHEEWMAAHQPAPSSRSATTGRSTPRRR